MALHLDELIEKIIIAKDGDSSFVLTNQNGKGWCAAIGNSSDCVPIGENIAYGDSGAHFIAYGDTPQNSLVALLAKVKPS